MPKGKANLGALKVADGKQTDPVVEKILKALEPYAEGMAKTIGHAGSAKKKGLGWKAGDIRAAQIGLDLLLNRVMGSADRLKEMFEALRDTQKEEDKLPSFEEITGIQPVTVADLAPEEEEEEAFPEFDDDGDNL